MNHQDALTWCFEYDLDDPDLKYSLSFDYRDGARVYYEQDPEHVWDSEFYSGVFYAYGHPEFSNVLERIEIPEYAPLTVSALGEFPGRQSSAVRVQLKGSLQDILLYGKKIGKDFAVPENAPSSVTYRLVLDNYEGEVSRFALEIIDPSLVNHPRIDEVKAKFLADLSEKVDPSTVFHTLNHVKVSLTDDCDYKFKVYFRININE